MTSRCGAAADPGPLCDHTFSGQVAPGHLGSTGRHEAAAERLEETVTPRHVALVCALALAAGFPGAAEAGKKQKKQKDGGEKDVVSIPH